MFENPYASPRSETLLPTTNHEQFYVVSIRKLVILSMATMGLYWFYWHYRQWAAWRAYSGQRVIAWLRAFFSFIFVYSLLCKVDTRQDLAERGFRWFPRTCAWLLIVLSALAFINVWLLQHQPVASLAVASLLQLLTLLVMIRVQRAINHLAGDPQGARNNQYSWANGTWILIGVLLWILNIGDMFLTSSGTVGI